MVERHRKSDKEPFIFGRYLPDTSGRLSPMKPTLCPRGIAVGGPCWIWGKGWRKRKTGPNFPLKRCFCVNHNRSFTVIPYDWAPRQREPIICDLPDELPECVEDGIARRKWPESPQCLDGIWSFKSQKRRLYFWTSLLGVEPGLGIREHKQAAATLGISTIKLLDAANHIREGPTYAGRARVIADVLKHLDGNKYFKLLRRGQESGFWGCPYNNDNRSPPSLSPP